MPKYQFFTTGSPVVIASLMIVNNCWCRVSAEPKGNLTPNLPAGVEIRTNGPDPFGDTQGTGGSKNLALIQYLKEGEKLSKIGQDDQAVTVLGKAVDMGERDTRAFYLRGVALYKLGKFESALADLNKVVEMAFVGLPKKFFSRLYTYRGDLYFAKHENVRAFQDIQKAITLEPTYSRAYSDRGTMLLSQKNYNDALADFSKAIELGPPESYYYSNRACCLIQLGKLQQALCDANEAVKLDSKGPSAYRIRANIFEKLGDVEQAKKDRVLEKQLPKAGVNSTITVFVAN
jgi:tetratricopeptide (TPR) repeat protein